MIAIKVLGLLALVAIAAGSGEKRIVGALPARPGQFPHFVAINTPMGGCGGALLNNRWIVTTARCVNRFLPPKVNVLIGATNRSDGTPYAVRHSVLHPRFNGVTNEHDIALVCTVKAITLVPGRVHPITLPRQPQRLPTRVWLIGFGRAQQAGTTVQLNRLESVALSREVCLKRINPHMANLFHADSVCAAPLNRNAGTCFGDRGLPLSVFYKGQHVLVGLNSWASSCGSGHPDVYTLVYPHLDFIQKTVRNHH